MNAKWTSWIVAGTVLVLLSSQVMAQPWGGGGRGQGFGRGQGMGMGGQGPGYMRQGMGPGGPQGGFGAWCPLGAGPRGRGAGGSPGFGQLGLGGQVARRLGLNDDQIEKIRAIVNEARSRTIAAIKEVLTEEQAAQLGQIQENAGRLGRGGRGPALQEGPGGPAGPGFQLGRGQGGQVGLRGQGPGRQPFAGGPGAGRGLRPQRRMNQPNAPTAPDANGQDTNPPRLGDRGVPPIERMFDQADTNNDGALTREEIRAFHESMGSGRGWQRQ